MDPRNHLVQGIWTSTKWLQDPRTTIMTQQKWKRKPLTCQCRLNISPKSSWSSSKMITNHLPQTTKRRALSKRKRASSSPPPNERISPKPKRHLALTIIRLIIIILSWTQVSLKSELRNEKQPNLWKLRQHHPQTNTKARTTFKKVHHKPKAIPSGKNYPILTQNNLLKTQDQANTLPSQAIRKKT